MTTEDLIERLREYSGNNGFGHIDYADTMRNAADALEALGREVAELKELSVTKIMIAVVPGDGSGFEVYAKSVKDVETKLGEMGGELEDWQLGIKRHPLMQERIDILSAELATIRAQEPVATIEISVRGSTTTIDNHFSDVVRDWPEGKYQLYASPTAKDAGLVESRTRTCHPDDNPPVPCAKKYALGECKAASFQVGSSSELNAIHAVVMSIGGDWPEVDGNPYTLARVKEMARSIKSGLVADGWKLVPVEPTPEMCKAARAVPEPNKPYPAHFHLIWDAMLAASPKIGGV